MKRRTRNSLRTSRLHRTIPHKKKKKRKCLRQRSHTLEKSLIQELSYELNQSKTDSKNIQKQGDKKLCDLSEPDLQVEETRVYDTVLSAPLNKTIDLCNDESSDCIVQHCSNSKPSPKLLIDLCKDTTDEVVIVDNITPMSIDKKPMTIVNLDDEDAPKNKDIVKLNEVNDDVVVIGTYNKVPLSSSASNKINDFFKYCVQVKKKPKPYHWTKWKFDRENYKNIPHKDHDVSGKRKHSRYYHTPEPGSQVDANVYTDAPVNLPKEGLRPIIIDGSNVAYGFSHDKNFSCKRLEICIKYFKERGHKVTAFVPQFRTMQYKSDDPDLLNKLVESGDVVLTPSRTVKGKNIVPYDDRFIVQTAVLQGGIIVTRDNYRDLLAENPAWAETINYRTLPYTFVDNVLMFPKDPLGAKGPSLEEFLRF